MNYKILKFSADWCMPCKVLNKKLEDFTDCEVVKYDVDDVDEEIIKKYRIRNIPVTILLDENEEEIQRWVGVFDVNEISNKIREING